MSNAGCPFCAIVRDEILIDHPLAVARRDTYPVSKGHTLIIPRRHVASFFETTEAERQAMLKLLDDAKELLDREHKPDGYNIGINDGQAARADGDAPAHPHRPALPRRQGRPPRGNSRDFSGQGGVLEGDEA